MSPPLSSFGVVWGAQTNKQMSTLLPKKPSPAFSSSWWVIQRKGWV